MAENDQEKTEQPTGKRLDEAYSKGQIAYSKDLTSAVLMFAALSAWKLGGDELFAVLIAVFHRTFELPVSIFLEDSQGRERLVGAVAGALASILPFAAVGIFAALLPGLIQVRFRLSRRKLEWDFTRLNPISGMSRLFSLHSLVTLLIDLLKFTLVGTVLWITIKNAMPELMSLGDRSLGDAMEIVVSLLFLIGWRLAGGMVVIGTLDWLFRRWRLMKDLMMTKEEVKEEGKQADGNPETKKRIKGAMRSIALKRMRTDIKGADVVIRNPTHFAVALKYESGKDPAPRVVAKGRALMALMIIKIAQDNGVEVVENRPLARELYKTVRLGATVPERLFRAVAEILAVVFRKRKGSKRSA